MTFEMFKISYGNWYWPTYQIEVQQCRGLRTGVGAYIQEITTYENSEMSYLTFGIGRLFCIIAELAVGELVCRQVVQENFLHN